MSLNILVIWAIAGGYFRGKRTMSWKDVKINRLARARKTSIDHALCFQRYGNQHNYFYQDLFDPLSDHLKNFNFDAVIFDTTATSMRFLPQTEAFENIVQRYSFLADWDCVKIAIPQDEYDRSAILDKWLSGCGVDVIYSTLCQHGSMLYPRTSKRGKILPTLTGYVNDADIDRIGLYAKPLGMRRVDIGYRARFLPAQFGSHGRVKGLLARRMQRALQGQNLTSDISTNPDGFFLGNDWLEFLGDCKFCLGSQSGSSLWDPSGEIAGRIVDYVEQYPNATFAKIEAACFPGEDRKWDFSAISPRIFEAAMVRSGQILVEGAYLDVLEPWRHYLPIDENCESAPEVFARMRDRPEMNRMIDACYSVLIESPQFRYSTHANEVLNQVLELVEQKRVQGASSEKFARMVLRHNRVATAKHHCDRKAIRWIRRSISSLVQKMAPAPSIH